MAYNKLKAHEYYMKHRKLKGRKRKTGLAGAGFGGSVSIKGLVAKPSKPASGKKTALAGSGFGSGSKTGVGIAGSQFGSKSVSGIKTGSISGIKSTSKKKKRKSKKR